MSRIPISTPYLGPAEEEAATETIRQGWVSSQGPQVRAFEAAFARATGNAQAVSCSSCTTGLTLALAALDIGPGDEVICPALTFIAPVNCVVHRGATPVLVDVSEETWNLTAAAVEAAVSPQTRAVIAVHAFGWPCDIAALAALCEARGLALIEDIAEAPFATVDGRQTGTFGTLGCHSFFANKIITTGEGGMVTAERADLAQRLFALRDHGQDPHEKYRFVEVGYNARMTAPQAAIGAVQLDRREELLQHRRAVHALYTELGQSLPLLAPTHPTGHQGVPWLPTYRLATGAAPLRDRLIARLDDAGVDLRPMIPPVHRTPVYAQRFGNLSLPASEAIAASSLHLPIGPHVTPACQERLVEILRQELVHAGA